MTQRIFDVENEKDMADLWNLLPENSIKIKKSTNSKYFDRLYRDNGDILAVCVLNINWHDKTEIIKPIQEATEADVGKLCYFWDDKVYDDEEEYKGYAILTLKDVAGGKPYYIADGNTTYGHCRRLTKQEIEELC